MAAEFLAEHAEHSRRYFLRAGLALAAIPTARSGAAEAPELARVVEKLEPYFTPQDVFQDVSRGKPLPHSLPVEKKREVGLTRETWKLEVIADPDNPAKLGKPHTKKDGTALDFETLLKLGERHAVRFAKVMTCLNIGCPLGMGIWEGVPLREVVWRAEPIENFRRIFYYGFHNNEPKQMFRSSLSVARVLEEPDGLPPVILCYKLNGQFLTPERGGPVRVVVPEAYGFKSIKWLSHVVLSNIAHANDTYADGNNDLDSPLKTFAATIHVPDSAKANEPLPITGYAQVGIAGLSKVQVWIQPKDKPWPADDKYFTKAPWVDATILGPPGKIAPDTFGFDTGGKPKVWPMPLTRAHWAILLPGVVAGEYVLRCRTIDAKGHAQPMPRPFKKSGRAEIEAVKLVVKA